MKKPFAAPRHAQTAKSMVAQEANVTGALGAEIAGPLHELCENGAPLKTKRLGTPNAHPRHASLSQELLPTLSASPTPCGPWRNNDPVSRQKMSFLPASSSCA